MALLSITNLRTSSITFQDPTGLYGTDILVPGSGASNNNAITLAALAAIESQLIAETTAANITWTVSDDPASSSDTLPEHEVVALVTPYNAVAGDQDILTNLTTPGAVSVVLSAAAKVGQYVKVVDQKGDAGANNVTVTVAGGGTINGGASAVINTNKGWVFLLKSGATSWVAQVSSVISSGAAGGDLTGTYPNPTIAANAVVTADINDLAVTTGKINDLAVTTGKINDLAVTTGKLAANAVDETKLATSVASAPALLSGPGTIDVTKRSTLYTSTGTGDALVLPNGTRTGQTHTVTHSTRGGGTGTAVITPTTPGNFATATLTNHWDWATFQWSGAHWDVLAAGVTGTIVA